MNESSSKTVQGGPGTTQDPQAQGSPILPSWLDTDLPEDPGKLFEAFQAQLAETVAKMAQAKAEGVEVPPELTQILEQMTQIQGPDQLDQSDKGDK